MWCGSPLPSAALGEAFPFCLFYQWGEEELSHGGDQLH